MTELTLDQTMASQLTDANAYLKLRDPQGSVIGYFMPAQPASPEVIFGVKSPFSREELERRYQEGKDKARPLAEFWDEMRKKYPDEFQ